MTDRPRFVQVPLAGLVALILATFVASVGLSALVVDVRSPKPSATLEPIRYVAFRAWSTPRPTTPPTTPPAATAKPTAVPVPTAAPKPSGASQTVNSTAYCLTGRMANGQRVYDGAVAMNGVPFGTRYRVESGPFAGRVLTVADRIGHGSQFDIAMPDRCRDALDYGRRSIQVAKV